MVKRLMIIFSLMMILGFMMTSTGFAFTVSSPFGWRFHPVTGKWHFHTGIDIPGSSGLGITALFDGKVVWAEKHQGYGNAILLYHAGHTYTLYGHCARIYVRRGQAVKAGERIATVGSTGVSTGPHLHLEYWVNGRYVDPVLLWQREKSRTGNDERGMN